MRVQIGCHNNTFASRQLRGMVAPSDSGRRWLVHPIGSEYDWKFGSPHIEIDTGHPERVVRVLAEHGEMHQVVSKQEFDERVEVVLEHEDISKDEAEGWVLDKQKCYTEDMIRAWGGVMSAFDELEKQWQALSTFAAFEVTL